MNRVVHYVNVWLRSGIGFMVLAAVCAPAVLTAQTAPATAAADWAALVGQRFRAERDVVYRNVNGVALKLDYYIPYDSKPGPTLVYIHGGGWQTGSKEQYVLWYLPYLQMGFRVVAVQYRLSGVAPAPAGVEDCMCAFRWVANHGAKYGVDPNRMVITGGSAGGHLVLLAAMAGDTLTPPDCREGAAPKARGVINYYGPTDLMAMLTGPPSVGKALAKWLGGGPGQDALARRLSPLGYVKAGVPPVLTLHGDADEMVPYAQAVALEKAMKAAGVEHTLITIPGGHHGRHTWTDGDTLRVQREIERFVGKLNLRFGE